MAASTQNILGEGSLGKDIALNTDKKLVFNVTRPNERVIPKDATVPIKIGSDLASTSLSDFMLSGYKATEPKANRPSLIDPLRDWFEVPRGSPATAYPVNWQNLNGSVTENAIVKDVCPDGNIWAVWKCYPLGDNNGDGGFDNGGGLIAIDNTKKYRLSIWVKRNTTSTGRTYFGMQQSSGFINLSAPATPDYNSYLWVDSPLALNEWSLLVGYINPVGYTANTMQTRQYNRNTGIMGQTPANPREYAFTSAITSLGIRAYYFYTNVAAVGEQNTQYFWNPRIDVCDGTEPSIADLLYLPSYTDITGISPTAPVTNRAGYHPLVGSISDGLAQITGNVSMTAAGRITTLPEHLRPIATVSTIQNSSAGLKQVDFLPNGDVMLISTGAITWLTVNASYPTAWAANKEKRI